MHGKAEYQMLCDVKLRGCAKVLKTTAGSVIWAHSVCAVHKVANAYNWVTLPDGRICCPHCRRTLRARGAL